MYFEAGETYRNDKVEFDVFILAIDEEMPNGVWLAILWVDPKTKDVESADELFVEIVNYKKWEKLEL